MNPNQLSNVLSKIRITFEKDKYSHYQNWIEKREVFEANTYISYFDRVGKLIFENLAKIDSETFLKAFSTLALMYHFDKKFIIPIHEKLELKILSDIYTLKEWEIADCIQNFGLLSYAPLNLISEA